MGLKANRLAVSQSHRLADCSLGLPSDIRAGLLFAF